MADDVAEPFELPRDAATAVGQRRAEQQHHVRTLGETNALEVRFVVDLDFGRDRDALPQILATLGGDTEQRLGVGAHEVAEFVREVREASGFLALHEPANGAEHPA